MTAYKSTSLSLASGIDFGIDFFEAHVGNTVFGNAALKKKYVPLSINQAPDFHRRQPHRLSVFHQHGFGPMYLPYSTSIAVLYYIFYKPRANAYLCYKDSLSASFKKSSAVGNCSHSILLSRAYSAASSSLPIAIYSFSSPETIFFPSR